MSEGAPMTFDFARDAEAPLAPSNCLAARSKYHTILLDPPWPIKWKKSEGVEVNEMKYPTLPISEIMNLPIRELSHDHCLLLMWATNAYLPEALGIIRGWRFEYDKLFTWCKNNGMGAHPRNATEHLVIAKRGNPPTLRGHHDKAILNWAEFPVSRRHSEKPPEMYGIIELFAPEPRIELFARKRRPGWDAWGNEIESDIVLQVGVVPPNCK